MADTDWKRLALHALADLRVMGVDIALVLGVTPEVLAEVDHFTRSELESYS